MLWKLFRAHITHAVFFLTLFQNVNNAAAAGFVMPIGVTTDRLCLRLRPGGDLLAQAEIQRLGRTSLHAERLLVLTETIAAHGTLAGFAGDVVFSNNVPGTRMNAVFAPDADIFVDDHRAFFIFGDGLHRAYGSARR